MTEFLNLLQSLPGLIATLLSVLWSIPVTLVWLMNLFAFTDVTMLAWFMLFLLSAYGVWRAWDWYHFKYHHARNPRLRTYSLAEKAFHALAAWWRSFLTTGWAGRFYRWTVTRMKKSRTRYRDTKFNLADHGTPWPDDKTPPRRRKSDEL